MIANPVPARYCPKLTLSVKVLDSFDYKTVSAVEVKVLEDFDDQRYSDCHRDIKSSLVLPKAYN